MARIKGHYNLGGYADRSKKMEIGDCLQVIIKNIDVTNKTVTVCISSDLPIRRPSPPVCPLFPTIHLGGREVCHTAPNYIVYEVSLETTGAGKNWPQVFPHWSNKSFSIPLWAIIPLSPRQQIKANIAVSLGQGIRGKDNLRLIAPKAAPSRDMAAFLITGGYKVRKILVKRLRVALYFSKLRDGAHLERMVRPVFEAHHKIFGEWLDKEVHLVFETQEKPLNKQKGVFIRAAGVSLGRFVVRSIHPKDRVDRVSLLDLIEHEFLHHYVETSTAGGDWITEGLTTYLSRKILLENQIINNQDWDYFVTKAYKEYLENPFGDKASLREVPSKLRYKHFANLLYSKGFLVTYLLDLALGGSLCNLAVTLFSEKVVHGKAFTERDFNHKLQPNMRRYLSELISTKDLSPYINQIPGFETRYVTS